MPYSSNYRRPYSRYSNNRNRYARRSSRPSRISTQSYIRAAAAAKLGVPQRKLWWNKERKEYQVHGPSERGKIGGDAEKERWSTIIDLAAEGNLEEIRKTEPNAFLHAYRTLRQIATDYMKPLPDLTMLDNYWVWGAPGLGKTLWVKSQHPEIYLKPCNKWWDGYQGQKVVLLDELEKRAAEFNMGHYLKEWCQHKHFLGEIKGGTIPIRFEKMYVTSNYSMEVIFKDDDVMLEAVKRRFKEVHFTAYKEATLMPYEQKGLDDIPFKIWEKTATGKRIRDADPAVDLIDEEMMEDPKRSRNEDTCCNGCEIMGAHLPVCHKYIPDNWYEK